MSLSLLKSKVYFTGRFLVKDGAFKGQRLEQGAKTLADKLRHKTLLGEPLTGDKAVKAMRTQRGVVYFHRFAGYENGGHIDLFESAKPFDDGCHSRCYFPGAKEIWFWLP